MNAPLRSVLHIGAGQKFIPNYVNNDSVRYVTNDHAALPGITWPADLNQMPWSFPDDYFDEVYAIDIIEHLNSPKQVLEEIYRLLKKGGFVDIQVPHFGSLAHASDMTHRHGFTPLSFGFFLVGHPYCNSQPWYSEARFNCLSFALDDMPQDQLLIPDDWREKMLLHKVVGNLQLRLSKI